MTLPAVAANVVEVDPCGIVTLEGTVAAVGDALIPIVAPPLSAADVSETVQVDPTDGVNVVGLHEILLKTGVCSMVTVAPLAVVGIETPDELADIALVSCTDEEVSDVELAKVSVTSAATLFGMGEEFSPQTRHVAEPAPLVQVRVLFAAPVAGANETDEKSTVE